jgi:hypothetical protein
MFFAPTVRITDKNKKDICREFNCVQCAQSSSVARRRLVVTWNNVIIAAIRETPITRAATETARSVSLLLQNDGWLKGNLRSYRFVIFMLFLQYLKRLQELR